MKKFLYRVVTDQINGWPINILKGVLWILSCFYGVIIGIIKLLYNFGILKRQKLPCPVISVGNITLGGVGKTPLIEYVAKILKEEGFNPVILTRGYMGQKGQESDEAQMLKKNLENVPVLIGSNRFKNAQEFLSNNSADVFLLDDGFQHWTLFRDMDIVALDATNPWGNKHLIPRGILREPLSALSRANIFILTKTDLARSNVVIVRDRLRLLGQNKLIVETIHEPKCLRDLKSQRKMDLSTISSKRVCMLSSIGDPQSFENMLTQLGASVQENFSFMDHHVYTQEQIEQLVKYCEGHHIPFVVTTQKDAVKLDAFLNLFSDKIKVLVLEINIVIVYGKEQLLERIHQLLRR